MRRELSRIWLETRKTIVFVEQSGTRDIRDRLESALENLVKVPDMPTRDLGKTWGAVELLPAGL